MEQNYRTLLRIKEELPVLFSLINFQERFPAELWRCEITPEIAQRLNRIVSFFFFDDHRARIRANVDLFV